MTVALPDNLRDLMLNLPGFQSFAAGVNDTTAIVVKIDPATADGWHGDIRIGYRAECGFYPGGAVMRLVFTVYDQPDRPFVFDTFLNPAQPDDLALLRGLAGQRAIDIHLFDLACDYLYSKRIRHRDPSRRELTGLINQAIRHNTRLTRFDYAAALAAMKRDRPI